MQDKVLIIGGSSDLGRELSKRLNYFTINADLVDKNAFADKYEFIDITSNVEKIKNIQYKYIVYIAGIHPLNVKNEEDYFKINVDGLKNVLDNVNLKTLKKVIYISTTSVKKNNLYAESKRQAEFFIEQFSKKNNISCVSLRTRGFTPYYSKYYKNFIDYANYVASGSVNIKDVVSAINNSLIKDLKGYNVFIIDGKDDFSSFVDINELIKLNPRFKDLINQIKFPETRPSYQQYSYNLIDYSPKYGFLHIFEEYEEFLKNKKIF